MTILPDIPPAVPLTLTGLFHENGQLFDIFRAGDSDRIIEADLWDVLPFDCFRRLIFERFGLRVVYRGGRWFKDVIEAAKRGGIEVTVDALTKTMWLNSGSLSFADAQDIAETVLSPMVQFEAARLEAAG
jgi:hypothetical protein